MRLTVAVIDLTPAGALAVEVFAVVAVVEELVELEEPTFAVLVSANEMFVTIALFVQVSQHSQGRGRHQYGGLASLCLLQCHAHH